MNEERSIKMLLLLFCFTYVLRMVLTTGVWFFSNAVKNLFANDQTYWLLSVYCMWVLWDSVPLCAMFISHYKNFSSFNEEEILYSDSSLD